MTLYHVNWCPDCIVVRHKLSELGVAYESVVVSSAHAFRQEVYEASGQTYVPVLIDEEMVLTETEDIIEYLEAHYAGKEG